MISLFHPEATSEAQSATRHYKNTHKSLGRDFREDLEETVS